MKKIRKIIGTLLIMLCLVVNFSCKEYLDIPNPTNSLGTETVFASKGTIDAFVNNMYYTWGGKAEFSLQYMRYSEILSDNSYNPTNFMYNEVDAGRLDPSSSQCMQCWGNFYLCIYDANLILEGLPKATATDITAAQKDTYLAAAYTIRAHAYYYLARTWGDVPLILASTPVVENALAKRTPVAEVYAQVVADLKKAMTLLPTTKNSDSRYIATKYQPEALLARVYTTLGNWAEAETAASSVISSGFYTLNTTNLNNVFLRGSTEAVVTMGNGYQKAYSANVITGVYGYFIALPPASGTSAASSATGNANISQELLSAFEAGDLRKTNWTILRNSDNYSNPNNRIWQYKYKYSVAFEAAPAGKEEDFIYCRLAEMYLIRAEARVRKASPDVTGAKADLNIIRSRAGLAGTTATTAADLITAIMKERRVELYFEGGFRWDDLCRTKTCDAVMKPLARRINWKPEFVLWPIPQAEITKNPYLVQNPGY